MNIEDVASLDIAAKLNMVVAEYACSSAGGLFVTRMVFIAECGDAIERYMLMIYRIFEEYIYWAGVNPNVQRREADEDVVVVMEGEDGEDYSLSTLFD